MGLLGMAFHPDFPADPRVFLSYTNARRRQLVSRISSFRTPDNGATLDPSTEQILLTVNQPESNHNGGHIAFGPDGYLYIGLGDGGGGGDQHGNPGNGQRLTTLLGKMLRIDVDGAPAPALHAFPPTIRFAQATRCVRRPAARAATARRSTHGASAIPGAGASIAQTASCGSGTSARTTWEEVDHVTSAAATTAGAAAKARTTSTAAAQRLRRRRAHRSGRRIRSHASAHRSPAATSIAARRRTSARRALSVRRFRLRPDLGAGSRDSATQPARADAAARLPA